MNRVLGQRYRVHLSPHMDRVQALCDETCFVPRPPAAGRRPGPQLLTAGEARTVRAFRAFRSAALAEWIARLQRRHRLHAAPACSGPMALRLAGLAGVPRLVDFVELESERRRQSAAARRWPVAAIRRREAGMQCQHELAVAPLRIASGAPGQALKVLAMQKALVASRPALEGVHARPDSEVLVASDAADDVRRIECALAPLAARREGVACPAAGAL